MHTIILITAQQDHRRNDIRKEMVVQELDEIISYHNIPYYYYKQKLKEKVGMTVPKRYKQEL